MYHDPVVLNGHITRANGTVDFSDEQQLWNAIVDKVARSPLNTRIMYMEWDMHHGVVEKKTGRSIKNYQVPTSYKGNQLVDDKKHSDIMDMIQDPSTSMHPFRTPQSLQQTAVESGSKRRSEHLEEQDENESEDADAHKVKRVNTGAATTHGKKSGDVSKADEKKPAKISGDASRVHDKQPETIPEVQFAGYNAEMLCAPKVIRQHTIGMLNEGQYLALFPTSHS
jgi:hypothetical protein